jgi:hypothetical protein
VTKTLPKDIGASVRARLLRIARERREDFQLVLTRYGATWNGKQPHEGLL